MSYGETTSPEIERVAALSLDAAFRVHRSLGPGLLESIYEACLAYELEKMGLRVRRQMILPVMYDGVRLDAGLRIDLLVEDVVIIEVKAVEKHHPLFEAQLLTYLKLTHLQLRLLINFNVTLLKDGIKRVVRSVDPKPPLP